MTGSVRAIDRRHFIGLSAGAAALAWAPARPGRPARRGAPAGPVLAGSANALAGMQQSFPRLLEGAHPLDVALAVVQVVEADPNDNSVGLGGLPNEDGVVQLDAAVMDGETHNSGAVACIENILHPSQVARLVMERTDHCLLVGRGAYEFARAHGHQHVELLTERARRIWLRWKETMSDQDDRLPPSGGREEEDQKQGSLLDGRGDAGPAGAADENESELALIERVLAERPTGTIHCSALSSTGHVACTTTTSGLSWKIPGRVGDSPIVGAGLYCEDGVGSAGATGRGEAAILACGSHACIELMRAGMAPLDAGMELLRRVTEQARRAAKWQPGLVDEKGVPTFGLKFYLLDLQGRTAGVSLKGGGSYAVADPDGGPRHEPLEALHA